MSVRPYVLLSCAMSVDGCIDDTSDERLVLSGPEDLDRVDALRAASDAILVGANTVRADNPRLVVRSQARRDERVARGLPEQPVKVTVTAGGLDPDRAFFRTGGEKIVYCPAASAGTIGKALGDVATVVGLADLSGFGELLDDLGRRGIRRLMVEGGGTIHTQFLSEDLADELQLAIAPLFVGEADAPRLAGPGRYPQSTTRRMTVVENRQVGDMVLIRYLARGSGA